MTLLSRIPAAFFGILALGLSASGYGCSPSGPAQADGAARGEQIVIAMQTAPTTLLDAYATLDDEINVSCVVGASLTNLELRDELIHVPGLSDRWDWTDGGKCITYHLRDAKWDDGKPVTAGDVVFTYRMLADEKFNSPRREYTLRIEKVEALSPMSVRFTFKKPYYRENQLADSGVGILPEHVYGSLDFKQMRGTDLALKPILHGPFRVADRKGAQVFVLERNESVVATSVPNLHRAMFMVIPDYDARLRSLLAGDIDVLDGVRPEDLQGLNDRNEFDITDRGQRFVDFVVWNLRLPQFQDVRIRRALTLATDRDGMNTALLKIAGREYGRQPIGTISPLLRGAYNDAVKPLPFDRKQAENLLDELGWKRPAPGAVREKSGNPLRFKMIVNLETPRRMQSARMIQQDLAAVGVDLELESMRFDELQKRIEKRDFEAAFYGFSVSLHMKFGEVWSTNSAFNISGFSSERVDNLAKSTENELDREKICAAMKEMQQIIYEEQPHTFISWFPRFAVVRKRFRNLGASALGLTTSLERCFVPLNLQRNFTGK